MNEMQSTPDQPYGGNERTADKEYNDEFKARMADLKAEAFVLARHEIFDQPFDEVSCPPEPVGDADAQGDAERREHQGIPPRRKRPELLPHLGHAVTIPRAALAAARAEESVRSPRLFAYPFFEF